jgi:hypothetical protein
LVQPGDCHCERSYTPSGEIQMRNRICSVRYMPLMPHLCLHNSTNFHGPNLVQ